jgi:hypothetical protein
MVEVIAHRSCGRRTIATLDGIGEGDVLFEQAVGVVLAVMQRYRNRRPGEQVFEDVSQNVVARERDQGHVKSAGATDGSKSVAGELRAPFLFNAFSKRLAGAVGRCFGEASCYVDFDDAARVE